jgi:hypothetical protein
VRARVAAAGGGAGARQQAAALERGCAGVSNECATHLPVDAFRGITAACVGSSRKPMWSVVTPQQLAAVNVAAVAGFVSSQLGGLTTACSGFTPAQIAALPPRGQCWGISTDCLGRIPPVAFGAWGEQCFSALVNTRGLGPRWSAVSQDQFAALSDDLIMVFQYGQSLNSLSFTACRAFTAHTFALLGSTRLNRFVCQGLPVSCFTGLSADAVGAVTDNCVAAWSPAFFSHMTPAQMAALPARTTRSLNPKDMDALSENPDHRTCGAMTPEFMRAMEKRQAPLCSGLSSVCIGAMAVPTLAAMPASCVRNFDERAFELLMVEQVGALSAAAVQAMQRPQMYVIPGSSCAGFTASQFIGSEPHESITCSGLSAECVAHLGDAVWRVMPRICFAAIGADALYRAVTLKQLALVPGESFALSGEKLYWLTRRFGAAFVNGVTRAQTAALPQMWQYTDLNAYSLMFDMDPVRIAPLTGVDMTPASLTMVKIAATAADVVGAVFTVAAMPSLSASLFAGLRCDHVCALSAAQIEAMSVEQLRNVSATFMQMATSDSVRALSPPQFAAAFANKHVRLWNMAPEAAAVVSLAQAQALPLDPFPAFDCPQVGYFARDVVAYFNTTSNAKARALWSKNYALCARFPATPPKADTTACTQSAGGYKVSPLLPFHDPPADKTCGEDFVGRCTAPHTTRAAASRICPPFDKGLGPPLVCDKLVCCLLPQSPDAPGGPAPVGGGYSLSSSAPVRPVTGVISASVSVSGGGGPPDDGGHGKGTLIIILSAVAVVGVVVAGFFVYSRHRRQQQKRSAQYENALLY